MKTEKQIQNRINKLRKRLSVLRENMKNSDDLTEENQILGELKALNWLEVNETQAKFNRKMDRLMLMRKK